jgi:hypothetical protein
MLLSCVLLDCRRARQQVLCRVTACTTVPLPGHCLLLAGRQRRARRAGRRWRPHSTQHTASVQAASGQAVARRPVVVVVAVVVAVVVVAAMEGRGGSRRGGRSVVSVNGGTVTVSPATAEAGPVKTSEKESGGEGGAKASVRSKAQENYARSMASRRGGRKSPPKPTAYVERREAAPTRVLSPPDQERVVSLGQQNRNDLEKLISTVPDEMMRMVLLQCCEQVTRENRLLKEIYLPLGRTAELVTCSLNGGDQRIIPSDQFMEASHLAGFSALFDEPGLPQNLRRTGISETLHRVSRTLNPVTGNLTSIAARVGRTIEGHVEPLLAGVAHSDFVLRGGASVLLVGPPNVGKTTVVRAAVSSPCLPGHRATSAAAAPAPRDYLGCPSLEASSVLIATAGVGRARHTNACINSCGSSRGFSRATGPASSLSSTSLSRSPDPETCPTPPWCGCSHRTL